MKSFLQDLRFGFRMLFKLPGVTLVAVIALALGIGANTAIFSVINALLLRPLPYAESDRLVAVVFGNENPSPDLALGRLYWPYPKFTALREHNTSFDSIAAYEQKEMTVNFTDQPEKAEVEMVTADYFPLLGVKAAIGRTFSPEEDRTPEAHPVILLSHKIWRQRFGGDPEVIGRTVYVRNFPYTVIGVLPADFRGHKGTADLWAPVMMAPKLAFPDILTSAGAWWLKVIARLKPGVTATQANAELAVLSERIEQLVPVPSPKLRRPSGSGKEFLRLIPLKETKIDPLIWRSFLILFAVVGFVLLISCANVANLSLARADARRKEFAVRLALGASKQRIVRQVLTESVMLSLVGGLAGLIVALWGIDWLLSARLWNKIGFWSQYAQTFDYFQVKLDLPVLAFNLLLAVVTGIAFGVLPALQAAKQNVNEMLKEGAGGSIAGSRSLRRPSVRGSLVVAQIALSLVLLAGAGLAIKSFWRLLSVKLGFDPQGVMTMSLGTERQGLDFYQQLLERTQRMPGVESASLARMAPLSGSVTRGPIEVEGRAGLDPGQSLCSFNIVTPDYFKTFRTSVLQGRVFGEQDRAGATHVAVISRAMAGEFWRGENPVGKRIKSPFRSRSQTDEQWIEVVGVVDDVKYGAVEDEVEPAVYLPQRQSALTADQLAVRVAGDPAPVIAAIRKEVYALDKTVPVYGVSTMQESVARVTSRYRYSAWLMGVFASLALLLSAIGIYGVVSYSVSARTHEIGIRVALGAQGTDIVRLIVTDGVGLIGAGMVIGLIVAFAATRMLKSQIYGVETTDPLTFIAVSLGLAVVAIVACYIPARRAMKVDPMVALRHE